MPRDIKTYTTCAPPDAAKSHKNFGGLTGWVVTNFLDATFLGKLGFGAFVLVLVAFLFSNPITAIATYAALVVALYNVEDWYFNLRLLCVKPGDTCLVGTVLSKSKQSFDGDAVFNILPAPYSKQDCIDAMKEHLWANMGLLRIPATFNDPPFSFEVGIEDRFPDLVDLMIGNPNANLDRVMKYLEKLQGKLNDGNDKDLFSNVYNHLIIGFLERLFVSKSGQNFNRHFLRKDSNVITDLATWNAIPNDYDPNKDWLAFNASFYNERFPNRYELPNTRLGLNPLCFKNRLARGAPMPFVHCEIDGNNVSNLINAAVLTLFAALILCLILQNPLFALLGLLILGLLGFLVFLIIKELGDATTPEFDFEDPIETGEEYVLNGDVVVVQGQWSMDTEHNQHFEIHPVKAYYVAGISDGVIDVFDTSDERITSGFTKLTNADITAELADEICRLVHDTETNDPPLVLTRTVPQALSYGLTTQYGGAGIR